MSLQSPEVEQSSGNKCWELSHSEDGWHQVTFVEGTTLTKQTVMDIAFELRALDPHDPIHLVVVIAGITDICPAASTQLAAAQPSTRLALMGSSHMDQVLAGFMMCNLKNAEIARYVTDHSEAAEYFRTA